MLHVRRSILARPLVSLLLVSAAAAFAGCNSTNEDVRDAPRPVPAASTSSERLVNHHSVPRSGPIRLHRAWHIPMEDNVTGAPLCDGGVIYAGDWGGKVFAVEAATGRVLWHTAVQTPNTEWAWHGFAGTGCLDQDTLYMASAEGTAYALDKFTGEVRWRAPFTEQPNAGNCGKILAHDGRLYIGVSSIEEALSLQPGFEPRFVGEVVALDARDGKEAWRRKLAEPPHNGVAVWSGFALDIPTETLYFTTGNNYTGDATELSDSIVAVDARTGTTKWSSQATERDVWTMAQPAGPDFDFAAAPQLFDIKIDGRTRALVGAGQKSGVFHAWDRETGERVWQTRVGAGEIAGGMMAEAAISEGRIYLWSNNGFQGQQPIDFPIHVAALDASTGRELWKLEMVQPAATTTAGVLLGDVYFVPSLDGRVRGYRASDGQLAWTSEEHASIGSSLAADGSGLYFGTGVPKDLGGKEAAPELVGYRTPDV